MLKDTLVYDNRAARPAFINYLNSFYKSCYGKKDAVAGSLIKDLTYYIQEITDYTTELNNVCWRAAGLFIRWEFNKEGRIRPYAYFKASELGDCGDEIKASLMKHVEGSLVRATVEGTRSRYYKMPLIKLLAAYYNYMLGGSCD